MYFCIRQGVYLTNTVMVFGFCPGFDGKIKKKRSTCKTGIDQAIRFYDVFYDSIIQKSSSILQLLMVNML